MKLRSENIWFLGSLVAGKVIYDEYNGKSWYNTGTSMLKNYLGTDLTVMAKAKTNFVPTFPLPEFAEYAGNMACDRPPKRRRLFVAHMYGGSTKRTMESHVQHLCKFKIDPNADFVYCPAACYLEYVREKFPDFIDVGVQNLYPNDFGNFTGEVSLPMVKELGASYVLVGTSHRRVYLGESDKFIRDKVRYVLNSGMKVIIFVSNISGECTDCTTEAIVAKQLDIVAPYIYIDEWDKVAFACEPPSCPRDEDDNEDHTYETIVAAQKMCKLVRDKVADKVGDEIAQRLRILYSGEACHASAPMFMTQEDIDGIVFCPRNETECFINIINSGLLVDRREKKMAEQRK